MLRDDEILDKLKEMADNDISANLIDDIKFIQAREYLKIYLRARLNSK